MRLYEVLNAEKPDKIVKDGVRTTSYYSFESVEKMVAIALATSGGTKTSESIVDILQPQLNEYQQIVLDYLKTRFGKHSIFVKSIFDPISDLLSDIWIDDVDIAFEQLDLKQEIQVLEAFAQWALEQEEEC